MLDLLRYSEPGDLTAMAVDLARRYRACKESGLYPLDSLAWAWADKAADKDDPKPGELDLRRTHTIGGSSRYTAFGAMARWLRDTSTLPEGTLVLSGSTGSGKNVAAMYAAIHRGGAYYLGSAISDLALGDSPLLRDLAKVPFLVLDELGREALFGPAASRIDTLLITRHDNLLATLITTNLTSAEFEIRYGKHLLDRVRTAGGYAEISGASRRVKDVKPLHTMIDRHCRIAALVDAVFTLTCSGRTNVPESVIDKLAAEFEITEGQIAEAVEKRKRTMVVPDELSDGPIGRALRVALGELPPAEGRRHD